MQAAEPSEGSGVNWLWKKIILFFNIIYYKYNFDLIKFIIYLNVHSGSALHAIIDLLTTLRGGGDEDEEGKDLDLREAWSLPMKR